MKNKKRESQMHESAARLYEVVKILRDIEGQAAVSRVMNVSAQTLGMWAIRGVSIDGALDAQRKLSCNAVWILDGTGPMLLSDAHGGTLERNGGGLADALKLTCETAREIQLLSIYRLSNQDNRRAIEIAIDLARKDLDILRWLNQGK
jgi:hypothetical protein